jgi:cysteine desulfurase
MMLDQLGICASSGSACTTGSLDPSHVLTAMGLSPADARSSVRFSLSLENSEAQINYVISQMQRIISKLEHFSLPGLLSQSPNRA